MCQIQSSETETAEIKLKKSTSQCRTRLNRQKETKHMLMSSVEFHVLCVEVGLDLGCHVVIGVVLGFSTQTQYQVQCSFLLDFEVHLCTYSQTVFCDRQLICCQIIAHFCIAQTGHLRCCLHRKQTKRSKSQSSNIAAEQTDMTWCAEDYVVLTARIVRSGYFQLECGSGR